MTESLSVIIPAAGKGKRLKCSAPKAAVPLADKPLVVHSVEPFLTVDALVELVIVQPPDTTLRDRLRRFIPDREEIRYTDGGSSRFESVRNGLRALRTTSETVLVHDAARPFVTGELIRRVCAKAEEEGAAIPALPIPDTVKRVENREVRETVEREGLYRVQTPQGFRRSWYERALARLSTEKGEALTDDAGVVQSAGYPVHVVEGEWANFKITFPEDLDRAETLMNQG